MTVILKGVYTGLDLLIRARDMLVAGGYFVTSWRKRSDSAAAKVDCAAQCIFMVFQGLDFSATYRCSSSEKERFWIRVGSGVTDVTRTATHGFVEEGRLSKETMYQLAAVALFRTGMALATPGNNSDICEKNGSWVNEAGTLCITAAELVNHRETLTNLVRNVANAAIRRVRVEVNGIEHNVLSIIQTIERYKAQRYHQIVEGQDQSIVPPFQNENEEQTFLTEMRNLHLNRLLCPISGRFIRHPIHLRDRPNVIVEQESLDAARNNHQDHILINNESIPLLAFENSPNPIEQALYENIYLRVRRVYALDQEIAAGYLALSQPETLQRIPRMVWDDPRLRYFCSAITREPIRFVVSPINSLRSCYEEASLRTWFQTTPNVLPPRWPADVPFDETHIQICQMFQGTIDERLQQIAAEITAAHLVQAQA